MVPAVGHVRVSWVAGRSGDSFLSPELQREKIADVARRESLEVVEILDELDVSGGNATRSLRDRALEMVERGELELRAQRDARRTGSHDL